MANATVSIILVNRYGFTLGKAMLLVILAIVGTLLGIIPGLMVIVFIYYYGKKIYGPLIKQSDNEPRYNDIERLSGLLKNGMITQQEFESEKRRVLSE